MQESTLEIEESREVQEGVKHPYIETDVERINKAYTLQEWADFIKRKSRS